MKIGVQFYTLRDFCKDSDGLAESLKKVADIGYTSVQLSGVCAYDPAWMRDLLNSLGLTCDLTHTNGSRLFSETDTVIDEHFLYGCHYIGLGGLPGGGKTAFENFELFRDNWGPVLEKMNKRGAKLMLHNHYGEFEKFDGKNTFELISDAFAPELVGFTFDTYWAQHAGADSIAWINQLKGRLNCVHFKDMSFDHNMAPVGSGCMNFDGIIKACLDNKVEFAFVEQDNCNGEDPFACVKKSYDYLTSMGLN